jgi:nicotinate-nucleotide pyrophosphorylase (carboxylating)
MKNAFKKYLPFAKLALREDIGRGDVTGNACISAGKTARAKIIAKSDGVLSGMAAAEAVFKSASRKIIFKPLIRDGSLLKAGAVIAEVRGPARAALAAERTALNILQYASGIATATAKYVRAVMGTGAVILDTRKIVPGMRMIAKEAVAHGGGVNHRIGLYDMILIKDNHIAIAGGIRAIGRLVASARKKYPNLPVEIEAENLTAALAAFKAGVDIIMLDNFTPSNFKKTAERLRIVALKTGEVLPLLEASGGITLKNVRKYALAGADRISVGAITHSATALDISMEFE